MYKKFCKETEQKFRESVPAKLLSIENNKPGEFWSLVKKMQKWGKPDTDTNSYIHPDTWLEHFNALLNEGEAAPTKLIDELEALEKQPAFSELDFRIKTHEIKKALGRLNKNASPGVDQKSGRLLFAGKKRADDCIQSFL